MEPRKMVYIDDDKLSREIQQKLALADEHVDLHIIRLIMKMQSLNYENLGIIKIVYRK